MYSYISVYELKGLYSTVCEIVLPNLPFKYLDYWYQQSLNKKQNVEHYNSLFAIQPDSYLGSKNLEKSYFVIQPKEYLSIKIE